MKIWIKKMRKWLRTKIGGFATALGTFIAFESKKITVFYGEIGGKGSYSTLIKTKKVKLPSESEQAKSQFSQFCTSPEGEIKYVYDWYVDQMY